MARVDLSLLTKNEVKMLTGHQRGLQSRTLFDLDRLEAEEDTISVVAPASLELISPSFVQGLLAAAMTKLGIEAIRQKYDFHALPRYLQEDIETGLQRLLLHVKRNTSH